MAEVIITDVESASLKSLFDNGDLDDVFGNSPTVVGVHAFVVGRQGGAVLLHGFPLLVTKTIPANLALGVSPDSTIEMTFNIFIQSSTIDSSSIVVDIS